MYNSETNKLLLKASLLPEENAVKSFREWEEKIDFEKISPDSYFLLPAVYKNLQKQKIESHIFPRIKGVHKKIWLENQIRIPKLKEVFKLLNTNGIDFIVLNNIFDVWDFYKDKGVFSLDGFEILIKSKNAKFVIERLSEIGWQKDSKPLMLLDFATLRYEKVMRLNINWQTDIYKKQIWQTAQKSYLDETEIKVLSATEQIVYLCRSDDFLNKNSFLINTTLKRNPNINWNELVLKANSQKICNSIYQMLKYLSETLDTKEPKEILDNLSKKINSEAFPTKKQNAISAYKSLYQTYLKNTSLDESESYSGFVKFLCKHWKVNSVFALPWQIGKRFFRQITN